ncbi:hypothetical protein ACWGTO_27520 [Mesorhizobium sp. PL10]
MPGKKVAPVSSVRNRAREDYDAVVASAQLGDIKMIRLKFDIKPKFFQVMVLENPEPVPSSQFDHRFENLSYNPDEGFLGGQIFWSARMMQGRSKLFSIDALYVITYEEVARVEEVHAFAFLKRVGRFATYPYYRALVSRLSAESGLNLPPLPVLK